MNQSASIGTAELFLIIDGTPIDQLVSHIQKLAGLADARKMLRVGDSGRSLRCPLEVDPQDFIGAIDSQSDHLWRIATHLTWNDEAVRRLHELSCNLQIDFRLTSAETVSICSSTMQQLSAQRIQLEIIPLQRG